MKEENKLKLREITKLYVLKRQQIRSEKEMDEEAYRKKRLAKKVKVVRGWQILKEMSLVPEIDDYSQEVPICLDYSLKTNPKEKVEFILYKGKFKYYLNVPFFVREDLSYDSLDSITYDVRFHELQDINCDLTYYNQYWCASFEDHTEKVVVDTCLKAQEQGKDKTLEKILDSLLSLNHQSSS